MLIPTMLFFLLLIPQQPEIVTCEVVEPDKSVACPEGGKMVLFTFTDANEAKAIFDEWRLVAPLQGNSVNSDAPLITAPVKAGDKVKAIITGTKFTQIAECRVRVWRNKKQWRWLREGEQPPNILSMLPEDCQPGYGKQANQ